MEIFVSILSVILFALASICNAMMDTLQFHWGTFRWNNKVNPQWWNPAISWRNKYVNGDKKQGLRFKGIWGWLSAFLDAWHLFKSASIVLIVLAIVLFPFAQPICISKNYYCNQFIWFAIFGLVWNGTFNLFFNKILVVKNE